MKSLSEEKGGCTMGTHVSLIVRGYDPFFEGLIFMVLGFKGRL